MRKGRAQRRSRQSRAPAPKSAPQLGAEPQLVIGVAPRAPSASELLESVQAEASPKWEDVRKLGRPEVVRASEPVEADAEAEAKADAASSGSEGARSAEPTSLEAVVTAVAASGDGLVIRTPADAVTPSPDEISIPPAGDLAHIDEEFFSEGDLGKHLVRDGAHDDEHWEADRAKPATHAPHVVARRERFARYVRWAVAGAAVVCVAALARTVVTPRVAKTSAATQAIGLGAPAEIVKTPDAPQPAVEAQRPAEPAVALAAAPEAPPAAPPADTKPAEAPAAATPPSAPEAKAAEAKVAEAKAEVVPPADAKSAAEEKTASRKALERGKLDDAIAAGERSVALDAEDGEAWLILGAAYQEKGKLGEARRCYASCMKQGKRGPRHECAAMLR